ncbi:hypothetical protein [Amorphus sp. 3PC139-8]|uniref:hypothetical protein n=1 Tax=Amorphus sp. 3PC139-8 TaxID=2735676 RepID=UPI00345DBDD4
MTTNLPTPKLQGVLNRAARSLPRETGTTATASRRVSATGPALICADVSGSMQAPAWGGRAKIEILREAIAAIMGEGGRRLITFSSRPTVDAPGIGPAGGGTDLAAALAACRELGPSHTLVVSDGQPDSSTAALAEAERLPGIIDVLYIGPDSDRAAMDFMRQLARTGMGACRSADIARTQVALAREIRLMIEHHR